MLPLWFEKLEIQNLGESGFRFVVIIDVPQKQMQKFGEVLKVNLGSKEFHR